MEDDTLRVFRLQTQHFLQVPGYRFSLTVLIGSQPNGIRLLRLALQLLDQPLFMRVNGIMRHIPVLKIDTQ